MATSRFAMKGAIMLQTILSFLAPNLTHASPADSIIGQTLLGTSFGTPFNATYDYVIVGGGTAGLTIANRLSESGQHSVAVIEAGSFYELSNSNLSQIPRYVWSGAGLTFDDVNPLVDWNFRTEPEPGIGGRRIHYPRGRTLGGSSARNHMVYHRSTKGAYKKWANEVGDPSYEWENWRTYFDKSITFHGDAGKRFANSTPDDDPAGKRATSGPVNVSYANWVVPITSWMVKVAEAMGLKRLPGYLDGELIGVSWDMRTMEPKTQTRESSETAYLRPAMERGNLIVYHSTMALKVLFNGTEAVGVLASTLGKHFTLKAKNEVIVSAGALQSPQLLMVSGIGPKATLDRFEIPVLVDAPSVGQGMQDHPTVSLTRKVRMPVSTVLDNEAKVEAATKEFLEGGAGPLASTGGDVFAWEKVPRRLVSNKTAIALSSAPEDWPDLEHLTSSLYPGTPPDKDDYIGIAVVLVNTFSRGNVTISSSSTLDPPVINVNFLSDTRDQEVAIAAVRRAREIFAHPTLSSVVYGPEVPGNTTSTDEQILKYIQASARTISHVSCTCKMGKKEDRAAVVDSAGRVFGVTKLRVVDASAMPFLPPGHPLATVYALGEKISDVILEDSLVEG